MIKDVSWDNSNVWYGSVGDADDITTKLSKLKKLLPNDTTYALMSTSSCVDLTKYHKKCGMLMGAMLAVAGVIVVGHVIKPTIEKVREKRKKKES